MVALVLVHLPVLAVAVVLVRLVQRMLGTLAGLVVLVLHRLLLEQALLTLVAAAALTVDRRAAAAQVAKVAVALVHLPQMATELPVQPIPAVVAVGVAHILEIRAAQVVPA